MTLLLSCYEGMRIVHCFLVGLLMLMMHFWGLHRIVEEKIGQVVMSCFSGDWGWEEAEGWILDLYINSELLST